MSEDLFAGVNNIITSVNQSVALSCDAKCRENRHTRQLYDNYLSAKENVSAGPQRLDQAEEKYFVYTKGEKWYNKFRTEKLEAEGITVAEHLLGQFRQRENLLKSLSADAVSSKSYASRLADLQNTYKQEVDDLKEKTRTLKTKTNVNHRLTFYDVDAIERKANYISWVRIAYYILVVAYAIIQLGYFGGFGELKIWITIACMVAVPYLMGYIIKLLHYVRVRGAKCTMKTS
jgi:hypothetical protein